MNWFGYWAITAIALAVCVKVYGLISTWHLVLSLVFVALSSLLFFSFQFGLWTKVIIKEKILPAFKYLYFESQGTFFSSASALEPKFSGIDTLKLIHDPNVKFIALFFEHTDWLVQPEKMRVCWGFALFGERSAVEHKDLIETMEARGATVKDLPECKMAFGRVPYVTVLSFILAIKKLYSPLFTYLRKLYPEQYFVNRPAPFIHVSSIEEIEVGAILGPNASPFSISTLPPPLHTDNHLQEISAHIKTE